MSDRCCETCRHDLGGGCCRINLEPECAAGEFEAWEAKEAMYKERLNENVEVEKTEPAVETVPIKPLTSFLGGYAVAPGMVGRFEQRDNRQAWERFLLSIDWSDEQNA